MTTPDELLKMAERLEGGTKMPTTGLGLSVRGNGDINFSPEVFQVTPHEAEAASLLRKLAGEMEWQGMETAPKDGDIIIAYGVMSFEMDMENDEKCTTLVEWAHGGWRPAGPTARGFKKFYPEKWRPLPKGEA